MSLRFIDRNADTPERIRRNFQRLRNGAGTSSVTAAAPITNTSTGIGLAFAANTGLALVANALALLFADGTITGSASGIKVSSTVVINTRRLTTTSPLAGGGDLSADRTLSIQQATSGQNGYLSSTDWTTFNNKSQVVAGDTSISTGTSTGSTTIFVRNAPVSTGAISTTASGIAVIHDTTLSTTAAGLGVHFAVASTSGLSSTAGGLAVVAGSGITFDSTGVAVDTTVVRTTRNITTTAPLGGGGSLASDRFLTIAQASSTTNGYLSSADWITFNGKAFTSLSTDPGSPANGTAWYNTTTGILRAKAAGNLISFPTTLAVGGPVTWANSVGFGQIGAAAVTPAAWFTVNRTVHVKCWGSYTALVSPSPTLVLGAFIDSANLQGDGPTITLAGSGSGRFYFDLAFTCIALGSTATIRSGGLMYCEINGVVTPFVLGTTLNVNVANGLTIEPVAQWSAASSTNSITGFGSEISVQV